MRESGCFVKVRVRKFSIPLALPLEIGINCLYPDATALIA